MRCRSGGKDQRSRASHVHIRASWACSVLSCARVGARAGNGRERGVRGSHVRESSKKRTVAREVAKVEALCREYVRRPSRAEDWVDRAGRGAHRGDVVVMALTVSGAFPSGSMVTAACPVTGILVVSFLVGVRACRRYQRCRVVVGWMRADEVRLRAKMGRRCYTSPWASLRNDERVWRW
jgi:hypothetical protein